MIAINPLHAVSASPTGVMKSPQTRGISAKGASTAMECI